MTFPCVESNITVFNNGYYELLIKIKYLNPNDAVEGHKKPRKSEKRNTIRKDFKAVVFKFVYFHILLQKKPGQIILKRVCNTECGWQPQRG